MSRLSKYILASIFTLTLSVAAPREASADDYRIAPPPPPETIEGGFGSTTFISGRITNTTDQPGGGPGRTIDSTSLSFTNGGGVNVAQLADEPPVANAFEYDTRALLVTQTLNTGNNFFSGLQLGQTSPTVGLFSVTILPGAVAGQRYLLFAFLTDLQGGVSNTIQLVVIPTAAVPEPATMILLGTGLAGVVAAARRRRRAS